MHFLYILVERGTFCIYLDISLWILSTTKLYLVWLYLHWGGILMKQKYLFDLCSSHLYWLSVHEMSLRVHQKSFSQTIMYSTKDLPYGSIITLKSDLLFGWLATFVNHKVFLKSACIWKLEYLQIHFNKNFPQTIAWLWKWSEWKIYSQSVII